MYEILLIIFEIALIIWSFSKGERWLRTTAFVHIFLVLALARKIGYFFGYPVNINSVLYGTFFLAQQLLYTYFSKTAAKETVWFVLYGIFIVVAVLGIISPLQSLGGLAGTPITIYTIAKTMAILFSLIYFSQMLFLILLDKAGKLNWYKYLGLTIIVQASQLLVNLPTTDNVQLTINACVFRILYLWLLFPIVNYLCELSVKYKE